MVERETNKIQAQAVSSLGNFCVYGNFCDLASNFASTFMLFGLLNQQKKHWKCLWLFTLETFLTVYQHRPPDGYPIVHALHSCKKFLEFGLLCYHNPFKSTPFILKKFLLHPLPHSLFSGTSQTSQKKNLWSYYYHFSYPLINRLDPWHFINTLLSMSPA